MTEAGFSEGVVRGLTGGQDEMSVDADQFDADLDVDGAGKDGAGWPSEVHPWAGLQDNPALGRDGAEASSAEQRADEPPAQ
jgi:hypothetical protein